MYLRIEMKAAVWYVTVRVRLIIASCWLNYQVMRVSWKRSRPGRQTFDSWMRPVFTLGDCRSCIAKSGVVFVPIFKSMWYYH